MDRDKVNLLTEKALELLGPISELLNVEVERGNGTFSDTEFNLKIVFRDKGGKSRMAKDYEARAELFDYKPLGSEIVLSNGKKAKIIGFKNRSPKFPVIVETADGQKYKLPESYVKEDV